MRQLRKVAFRVNRKILKRHKRERERNHQKMQRQQQSVAAAQLDQIAPLQPVNVENDQPLYHSFIMVPNQYVTYQTQENSLLMQAASIEPGTMHVEMPDLKRLDEARENVWKVDGDMDRLREEWVNERKEMIEAFGER